jgi:hypothetical protein
MGRLLGAPIAGYERQCYKYACNINDLYNFQCIISRIREGELPRSSRKAFVGVAAKAASSKGIGFHNSEAN